MNFFQDVMKISRSRAMDVLAMFQTIITLSFICRDEEVIRLVEDGNRKNIGMLTCSLPMLGYAQSHNDCNRIHQHCFVRNLKINRKTMLMDAITVIVTLRIS